MVALSLVGALLFACAETGPPLDGAKFMRTAEIEGVGAPLGSPACLGCHGHQPAPSYHLDCEGCHGSGQRHVQDVLDPVHIKFPANGICLDCHATGHRGLLDWETTEHARAGLLCTHCHDPHRSEPQLLRTDAPLGRTLLPQASASTRLCVECHRDVGAKLDLPSHHPVREGMLDCIDCHAPHASAQVASGLETARCTGCHQAQRGPWIFEHTPVAEDCGYCHVPHGAAADNLLVANQPGACVYCHTVAEMGAVHEPQAFVTRCTDCHNAIDGSFADPHLRR